MGKYTDTGGQKFFKPQKILKLIQSNLDLVTSQISDPPREFSRQHDHAGMHCKSINTVNLNLVTLSLRFSDPSLECH
jgi:hypothetical protein